MQNNLLDIIFNPNAAHKFPLLRRLSIASLLSILATTTLLIYLYRQDQITEHTRVAAEANLKTLSYLTHSLDKQISAYISNSERLNAKAKPANPKLDSLFTSALKVIRKDGILKLEIYNMAGIAIYSSVKDDIGKRSKHPAFMARAIRGEAVHNVEYRFMFLGMKGEMYDVEVALTYMPLVLAGKQIGVIGIYDDATPVLNRLRANTIKIILIVFIVISALYAALFLSVFKADRALAGWQKSVAENEERLKFATRAGGIGIWDYDLIRNVLVWDDFMFVLYGEMRGNFSATYEAWQKFVHPDDFINVNQQVQDAFQGIKPFDTEFRIALSNGDVRYIKAFGEVFRDEHNKPLRMIGVNLDITARKQAEEDIHNLAFYDALTKLPNRRLFIDRASAALIASTRHNNYGAILFIDLDNFKPLNDTFGHDYGDLMLMEVCVRIKSRVRQIDTVARFGGDEFVVLIEAFSNEREDATHKVALVAEKIREVLNQPYMLKGHEHHSSTSIGISLFHGNDEPLEILIEHADNAMYQVKKSGRNGVRFFDPCK